MDLQRFESINQTHAATTVSDKYKFIPTTKVLDVLADYGWMPHKAMQARTRVEAKQGYQKHAIALCNEKLQRELSISNAIAPQILLINSHAGTSSFVMQLAAHVALCSNGVIRASGVSDEIRVRHSGYEDLFIADAAVQLANEVPNMMGEIDAYQSIILTPEERLAFARSAIELRFDGERYAVEPEQMLRSYRSGEQAPTLWNTFNVVQEKVIKGGVRQRRADRSHIRSRKVSSIDENVKLNKGLWVLQKEMARIKGVEIH